MIKNEPAHLDANILIVDDNAANVDLLDMMLSITGYQNCQSTTDPREVKSLCEATEFDLILLDIRMPHLDGFQVMEQLFELRGDNFLPILVLTAQKDMDTRLRALEMGATDFATKPFDKYEIVNRIKNLLDVRFAHKAQKRTAEILEEKVQQRTLELHDTRLQIIRKLGRAGEYRDNETGMHVIRVSKSSQALALAAGLGEAFADLMLNASPMHDVGKIGIPDSILLKPGKLDPDEWEIMKTHATIGSDIIGNDDIELIQIARSIAITHHEKWNGKGYPNQLKGEDIPIEGRVTAICDVFDALTSERPYKEAWSVEKAVSLINKESGEHFDPNLVRLFNEILPNILEIRDTYKDDEELDVSRKML